MTTEQLEWQCITKSRNGNYYAYLLPQNGMVIIFQSGKNVHNFSTLEQAQKQFPTLIVLN